MKICNAQNEITTEYVLPDKIIVSENAQNPEYLLNEHPRQAFLGDVPVCIIKKGGYILYDFGEEFHGGADFVIEKVEGAATYAKIRTVFGESVSEVLSSVGEKNAVNEHSPRDITIETGWLSHHIVGNTGYRFLKLEAVDADFHISSLQGISRIRKLEYKGSFRSDSERLNKIWQVGARTVHLNMQEYLWDGIKRDKLVWIGDMHPEFSSISMVFGDYSVVKKSLDFISSMTPPDKWCNGLASYSMWWIKIQRDLYWYGGDFEYLKSTAGFLTDTLKAITSAYKSGTEFSHFCEWSSAETEDEDAGFYSMLVIGLEAGAELLHILKENPELAAECSCLAADIKKKTFTDVKNKQVAAILALSGICDPKKMCTDIIKPGGAKGLSTFWGYYVLNALAENNDMCFALDIIDKYWGAMLDMGATTFWEDFDIEWLDNASPIDRICPPDKKDIHGDFGKFCYKGLRHSLCHGWASGPTAFLSRKVLGIIPAEPGYKKIKVHPDLGNLTFAEGCVPTPSGIIRVRHEKTGSEIKTQLTLPNGIEKI